MLQELSVKGHPGLSVLFKLISCYNFINQVWFIPHYLYSLQILNKTIMSQSYFHHPIDSVLSWALKKIPIQARAHNKKVTTIVKHFRNLLFLYTLLGNLVLKMWINVWENAFIGNKKMLILLFVLCVHFACARVFFPKPVDVGSSNELYSKVEAGTMALLSE